MTILQVSILIAVSALIGIYFARLSRKEKARMLGQLSVEVFLQIILPIVLLLVIIWLGAFGYIGNRR
jgi:hypothetical protein